MPTRLLRDEGHDLTVFYANSNIAPAAEYDKRLVELQKYAHMQGFEVIEGAYDPAAWERDVAPIGEALKDFSPALRAADGDTAKREVPVWSQSQDCTVDGRKEVASCEDGRSVSAPQTDAAPRTDAAPQTDEALQTDAAPRTVAELLDDENRKRRCRACYRMRLEESAAFAAANGYDGLATTLAVSPYQFTDVIHEELVRACGQAGIEAHFQDYRPYYDEATRISRELNMYRQNYCGCRFSIVEGQATREFIKQQRKQQKAAKQLQRAQEEERRARNAAEKQAYAEKQAKKRAILKGFRETAR